MILLGSTGSIGVNALKIALDNNINVEVLSAGNNIELLNKQIKLAKPKIIVIKNHNDKSKIIKNKNQKILSGEEGILEALDTSKSKLVVNAIVGFSGLKPSIHSVNLGKTLALANKETLAIAGSFINTKNIIPIDSEHFALKELIKNKKNINSIIITASGGAIRECELSTINNKTPKEVLKHPTWNMGSKITIDSATMVNKLLEILEAKWLFNMNNIDAIIEKNSIIHALISTKDNAVFTHMSKPDMKLPISYAILGEKAGNKPFVDMLNLLEFDFKFEKINKDRYPVWNLKNYILENPKTGVILNAANEVLVEYFLAYKIKFGDISNGIYKAMDKFSNIANNINNIDDVIAYDNDIRKFIREIY